MNIYRFVAVRLSIVLLAIASESAIADVDPLILEKASQGDALAQISVGDIYNFGKGVPKDYSEAVTWYRKSAEQGDAVGQSKLGMMYDIGRGVPLDFTQAEYWIRKAAIQGNPLGQNILAGMYTAGHGVTQDKTQAAYWHRKAAEQGDAIGQYNLAIMYYHGQGGLPKNEMVAYMLLVLATSQANFNDIKIATGWRNSLATQLPIKSLQKARSLASQWKVGDSLSF